MKEVILGLAVIGLFAFAYFVVGRIDGFLKTAGPGAGRQRTKSGEVYVTFVDEKNAAAAAARIRRLGDAIGTCAIVVCGAQDPEIADYIDPEWHIEDCRYHIE